MRRASGLLTAEGAYTLALDGMFLKKEPQEMPGWFRAFSFRATLTFL